MKTIQLTQGKVALVDDDMYDYLSQRNWYAEFNVNHYYAACKVSRKVVRMHRIIVNAPEGMVIDHINGNSLDNRRENLRVCTHAQNIHNQKMNAKNTSGYKGVVWNKVYKKWYARIKINRKFKHIGVFDDAEEAAHAYDEKAIELFGEFARTNFTD
jgi:hypothetical protein